MIKIGTWVYNRIFCQYIGKDLYGNKYYVSRLKNAEGKNTRSVIYKGIPEATKIPPLWHAWIHYMTDKIPSNREIKSYEWQKDYLPNLTGTKLAYFPKGHPRAGGKRDKATGDYEAWKPGN